MIRSRRSRPATAAVVAALAVATLAACDGSSDPDASPSIDPSRIVTSPSLDAGERSLVEVLGLMGATEVGTVESEGATAFAYGRVDDRSLVLRSFAKPADATKGRPLGTADAAGTQVRLLRTDGFGIIAVIPCGPSTYELSVREVDAATSRSQADVEQFSGVLVQVAGCP